MRTLNGYDAARLLNIFKVDHVCVNSVGTKKEILSAVDKLVQDHENTIQISSQLVC